MYNLNLLLLNFPYYGVIKFGSFTLKAIKSFMIILFKIQILLKTVDRLLFYLSYLAKTYIAVIVILSYSEILTSYFTLINSNKITSQETCENICCIYNVYCIMCNVYPEMQKRKKIARMNISAKKIAQKMRILRHLEIRAKTNQVALMFA